MNWSNFPNSFTKLNLIFLQEIEDVYVDHCAKTNYGKNPSVFCVKTAQRAFTLMAPTPESMRIWIDVIFTGAEGHF